MPVSALVNAQVDYAIPVAEMGSLLSRLVTLPAEPSRQGGAPLPSSESHTPDPALGEAHGLEDDTTNGASSGLTCPECGGAIWELRAGGLVRYRCHVGHAFNAQNMVSLQAGALESALWGAIRALEEKAELSRRLGTHARARGWDRSAAQFEGATLEAERGSEAIRQLVISGVGDVPAVEGEA